MALLKSNSHDENYALFLFMSNFLHLLCANPKMLFDEPPPPTVRDAQKRSVYDFFISHRHEISYEYSQKLATQLRDFGYQVYFAEQNLGLKRNMLEKELRSKLHSSSILVVVGNSDIFESEWVEWEMETFYGDHWGRRVPIITEKNGVSHHFYDLNGRTIKKYTCL